jgi:hypothetical protein
MASIRMTEAPSTDAVDPALADNVNLNAVVTAGARTRG